MKQRLHWLALHGFVRAMAAMGARGGDLQARLIADPTVAANPVPFYDELRGQGPLIKGRVNYLAVDHPLAHELLRSDDFRVLMLGSNLPRPIRWLERHARDDVLHPLRAPSLLAVEPPEHTRYRKTVSAVFTSRAVAALRDRVDQTAVSLLDQLAQQATTSGGVVDIVDRYCSQLPVAIISDILGVPERDRGRVLEFGELAAPSLDIGLPWRQYRSVQEGLAGFNVWLVEHLRQLRRNPGDNLMSLMIQAGESGSPETHLDETELLAIAGLVLAAGFETTVNLLGNGIRMLLDTPENLDTLRQRPELWPNAVEEILRLESPVQLTARIALNDVEIAGMQIEARRVGGGLSGRRQPGSVRVPRPTSLRHRAAQRREASRVFRGPALLPGGRPCAGRGRSGAACVLRALPRCAGRRHRKQAGHPGAAGLVDIAGDLGPGTFDGSSRELATLWLTPVRQPS